MAQTSIQVLASILPALLSQLPAGAKGINSSSYFMPNVNDSTIGMFYFDSSYKDIVNGLLAAPDLQAKFLQAYAATVRYAKQGQGITIAGPAIQTDPDSVNLINGAVNLVNNDPTLTSIDFKASGIWTSLSRDQMIAIGRAVGNYVQKCFSAERAISNKIVAGTYTTTAQLDSAVEWPSTAY